jgi:hypothetical protein
MSKDNNYKKFYGEKVFFPEGKMDISFTENLYVWGAYGLFTREGETESLKSPAKCNRSFIGFGGGVRIKIVTPLYIYIEGGGVFSTFKEEGESFLSKGSKMGFTVNGGIRIDIVRGVYINMFGGYIGGSKMLLKGKEIDLGGVRAGGGLGLCF